MNVRTLVLIGAIVLVGIGAIMMLGEFFQPAAPAATMVPAVARTQIQPYTIVTQDMVASGPTVTERTGRTSGAWSLENVVGKMSTGLIAPGTSLTAQNVLPVEQVRYTADPSLEVVSLNASVDKMVAGKIKPGSLVNIYGFGRELGTNQPYTEMVQDYVWVVAVTAGGTNVTNATVVPDPRTGVVSRTGDEDRPATTLTVAVEPEIAFKLIDKFGAQGLVPWVTLAADLSVGAAPPATPLPAATATPGLPIDLALTATALYEAISATDVPSGPPTGGGGEALR
jgi:hypothetical protein